MTRDNITLLAFDTSAAHCAAAVFADGAVQHAATEPMAKGQAERILVLCQEMLAQSELTLEGISAIGIGVGPGNFTGIRISVSAARGLALALGVPAIPVSTFEMLCAPDAPEAVAHELVVVGAPRDAAYVQRFTQGRPLSEPELIDPTAIPTHFAQTGLCVTGHMAETIAAQLGAQARPCQVENPAGTIARVAAWKYAQGYDMGKQPAPLYVRAPDAAPARDTPPIILP